MAVITISRGSYSKGREVAERVAQTLGYECVSRDILLEASQTYNTPEIKLMQAIHDGPSIFKGTQSKEKYIAFIRSALLTHLSQDNVVYHGLAGHFFVSGISHVLKVRIQADRADRIKEKMQREKMRYEEALSILKKDDAHRRRWSRELYGIDSWDASLYDLVIHIHNLTTSDAAELICYTARLPQFVPTAASRQAMADHLLAARLKAALVDLPASLDIRVNGRRVQVQVEAVTHLHQMLTSQITEIVNRFPEVGNLSLKMARLTPYAEDGVTLS